MSKRLNEIIRRKKNNGQKLLSVFVTAGFPEKDATKDIIIQLDRSGVDFIELGIPFSDPVADGPVIQQASQKALNNGITLKKIIQIVAEIRKESQIPIILMGYLNPVYQYGFDAFFNYASRAGADGLILPDWPLEESAVYADTLKSLDLDLIHLIAPNTSKERIKQIDKSSTSFIYCVAYTGVTGRSGINSQSQAFINNLNTLLSKPHLIGFGVKSHNDFKYYGRFADGVIIGSAFINLLEKTIKNEREQMIARFVRSIKEEQQ
jgi:tryptophan synthase alpha chain